MWQEFRFFPESDAMRDKLIAYLSEDDACQALTIENNESDEIYEPPLGESPLWKKTQIIALYEKDYSPETLIFSMIQTLGRIPPYETAQIADQDWERTCLVDFHPIDLGHDLWICPSWLTPPKPEAKIIHLDPGLAFGTGRHPTTALCLKWIASQEWIDKTIIDYGCGSGILGLAAAILGANRCYALDIDQQALSATVDNIEKNDLDQTKWHISLPENCPPIEGDVVFANILAGPLVSLAPTLKNLCKKNGMILLSGLLETQIDTIQNAYKPWFKFEKPRIEGEWACLIGKRF